MTDKESMKLALEALKELHNTNSYWWQEVDEQTIKKIKQSITALEEVLAQPEQEPVAILNHAHGVHTFRNVNLKGLPDGEYLVYTIPPQRTEQNFCQRCGKRTKDLTHIHTCTPPQENT
jgi:hypothetical protein